MFRKGDKVTVEGIVEWDEERGQVFVKIGVSTPWVETSSVTMVAPMLNVGERVVEQNGQDWEILAIHGDLAWCGGGPNFTKVCKVADLLRVRDVEAAAEAPLSEPEQVGTVDLTQPDVGESIAGPDEVQF